MNAPLHHASEYLAETPAAWTETRPGVFDLRLNANANFLVVQEGARYEILLPGLGRQKCWNRNQVERYARDYHENPPVEDEPEPDDASGIPTDEELLRHFRGQVI